MPKTKQESLSLDMVGRFPDNWPTKTLSQVCAQVTDGTHDSPKPTEQGFPLVTGKSIKNRQINFTNTYKISSSDHQKVIARSMPERDDILFANIGNSIGDLVRVETDCEFSIKNLALFKPDKSSIVPRFLEYYLFSQSVQAFVKGSTRGSAQPFIGLSTLRGFPVPVPPLDEQLYIAKVLGDLDDKIQLNHQINQTLEQMAQAIFKSWFVDFDPVKAKIAALEAGGSEDDALLAAIQAVSGKTPEDLSRLQAEQPEQYAELRATAELFPSAMQDSELGEIPEGWNIAPISDFGKVICGKTPSKQKPGFYGENVPFIKIPDMHGNVFATHTSDHLSSAGAASQSKKTIPKGSVCVSCIATVGQVVITTEESHTNQQINSIVPFESCYTPYLYFRMQSLYEHLHDLASGGSATLNLNTGSFSKIRILMPSKTLLDSFAKSSSALFEGILNNVNSAQTLGSLRDILLPKLLSGELSVSDAETQLAEAEEAANV
jgi:type I restriction enzyme S subunit